MKKYFLMLTSLFFIIIIVSACSTKNEIGETVAPVYLVVYNITPDVQGSRYFGDVIYQGIVHDEAVSVDLRNLPKNPNDTAYDPVVSEGTFTDILVNRCRISYTRTDGGKVAPDGFDNSMNLYIRMNMGSLMHGLIILRGAQKLQPPLSFIQPFNLGFEPSTNYTTIGCRALLEFSGETMAGEKVFASGQIDIVFADYGDE